MPFLPSREERSGKPDERQAQAPGEDCPGVTIQNTNLGVRCISLHFTHLLVQSIHLLADRTYTSLVDISLKLAGAARRRSDTLSQGRHHRHKNNNLARDISPVHPGFRRQDLHRWPRSREAGKGKQLRVTRFCKAASMLLPSIRDKAIFQPSIIHPLFTWGGDRRKESDGREAR